MPQYTPPNSDAVDFALESYSPPDSDAVDFDFDLGARLSADVATTTTTGQDATLIPGETQIPAETATITSAGQEATLDPGAVGLVAGIGGTTSAGQPAQFAVGSVPLTADVGETASTGQDATLTAPVWMVDGWPLRTNDSMTLTANAVSLGFDATDSEISRWREYERAGDYRESSEYGGGWELVDDQGREGPVTVVPPNDMTPPLDTFDGYTQSYNEQQISATRYGIDLTIQRLSERLDEYDAPDQSGGDWSFDLAHGTIALDAEQVSRAGQRGSTSGGEWSVTLFCDDVQAAAVVDSAGVPNAVTNRSVGDGEDFVADTSDGRQTVTVGSPPDAALPSGDYLIPDWSLERNVPGGRRRWQVSVTLSDS